MARGRESASPLRPALEIVRHVLHARVARGRVDRERLADDGAEIAGELAPQARRSRYCRGAAAASRDDLVRRCRLRARQRALDRGHQRHAQRRTALTPVSSSYSTRPRLY